MGTITPSVGDRTEQAFRKVVEKVIGWRRGALGEAATEANTLWVREKTQEEIARDSLDPGEKAYNLGERRYESREGLYER